MAAISAVWQSVRCWRRRSSEPVLVKVPTTLSGLEISDPRVAQEISGAVAQFGVCADGIAGHRVVRYSLPQPSNTYRVGAVHAHGRQLAIDGGPHVNRGAVRGSVE